MLEKGYNPLIDFFSRTFDPLEALHDPTLEPPDPHVLPMDNPGRLMLLLPWEYQDSLNNTETYIPSTRRADDECRRAGEKIKRNAMSQTARASSARAMTKFRGGTQKDGPFSVLAECVVSMTPVKVRVRRPGVLWTSVCGVVQLFDSYFNLVLVDAVQTSSRVVGLSSVYVCVCLCRVEVVVALRI
eukprot:GHVR01142120.1.p1 GENE.GHVR01142120.1~~GHVR01142120.1.p1  ORF type:complete len:194 (-),score=50.74 GHVR01142120.1:110-667(-)